MADIEQLGLLPGRRDKDLVAYETDADVLLKEEIRLALIAKRIREEEELKAAKLAKAKEDAEAGIAAQKEQENNKENEDGSE